VDSPRVRSAAEWRDFWRERGERELRLLLWAAWDPIAGASLSEYDACTTRVATLLGSRASCEALAAELGRIRAGELGLDADQAADERAAAKISRWFAVA
jgi:hypothetical protein